MANPGGTQYPKGFLWLPFAQTVDETGSPRKMVLNSLGFNRE